MKKTFSEIQAPSVNGRRLLWSASLLSLCVLPACSDSDNDENLARGEEPVAPELITSLLDVNADAEAQAQRVTNFNISGTRALANVADEGKVTEVKAGATIPATIPSGETVKITEDGEYALADGATTLTVEGNLVSEGTVSLPGVTVEVKGGTLNVAKLLTSALTVESGAATVGEGTLITNNITVNGGTLTVSGNARTVANLVLSGTAQVAVAAGKTLTADADIQLNSTTAKFTSSTTSYSYLKGKTLVVSDVDLTTNFGFGYYAVGVSYLKKGANSVSSAKLELPATLNLTTTPADFESWTKTSGQDTTILRQIAIVKNSESASKKGMSATGIVVNGENIYVSFHTNGSDVNGAIDVATFTNGKAAVLQTLTTTTSNNLEFNYITLAGGKIYAVGTRDNVTTETDTEGNETTKTGENGVIGVIDNPTSATPTLSTRSLYAGDGNGIILNGDYLHVASIYGVETYVASDLRRVAAIPTDGHVKSIVKSGNSIVTLNYAGAVKGDNAATSTVSYTDSVGATKTLTSVPFVVNTYATTDITLESPTTHTGGYGNVSAIVPIYGKNTIAIDGSTSYVAAGANGVVRSDGTLFQLSRPKESKSTLPLGYANCVAVDANYVYVAYGAAGVYVLDKNNFPTVVANYKNAGGKSANFVTAADGKIYVAYGADSWQILQLTDVKK
jgi:hypothetical protein